MATYYPISPFPVQFVNPDTGALLSGGTLEAYVAGTSTPTPMYTDTSGTSAGSSIILNSGGYPEVSGSTVAIHLSSSITYKFILKNSSGSQIWSVDNISNIVVESSAVKDDVQDGSYVYAADTGTANAYAMTLSPAIAAYTTGAEYRFKAGNANTGASTLAVNGLTAKNIYKNNDTALVAGDIQADDIVTVVYDGTQFQMRSASTVPDYGGTAQRVGWVPARSGDVSTSRNFATSDLGNIVFVSATATLTIPSSLGSDDNTLINVMVGNGATTTITPGSGVSLIWYQGGSRSTGTRTLAQNSAVTLWRYNSTTWVMYGNGIS